MIISDPRFVKSPDNFVARFFGSLATQGVCNFLEGHSWTRSVGRSLGRNKREPNHFNDANTLDRGWRAAHTPVDLAQPRDLAPKPFRLKVPHSGPTGCLYGYGAADADALHQWAAAAFADPLQSLIIPAVGMDSKPMPSKWQTGRRLGFDVRIRPPASRARGTAILAGIGAAVTQECGRQYGTRLELSLSGLQLLYTFVSSVSGKREKPEGETGHQLH